MTGIGTRLYDSLTNLVTGMGVEGRAKNASNKFALQCLTPLDLIAAYRGDWVAKKIIRIPASDMTREWREWKADDSDISALEQVEQQLCVQLKVRQAMTLDRLFGGAVMVMGGLPGDPSAELIPETVGKGALKYLNVLNRWQITAGPVETDPLSEFYGEPQYYEVNSATRAVRIHPSRVIRFVDEPIPSGVQTSPFDGWGDPILQSVYDAVMNVASSQQSIADLLVEAKIDIVSIPNLMASVASESEKKNLLTRFSLAALAKGSNNVLLLDKEEVWDQKQIDFGQIPDLAQMFMQVAAASADIPVTRMLGQSPKGLSATGDMDLQNYYDGLGGKQKNDLTPKLNKLDAVMLRSALGAIPDDLWWEFAPLWQMSDKDKAMVGLQKAQATQIYFTVGALPADALAKGVQSQLIEDGTYPGLEQFIDESTMEIEALNPPDPERDPANDPNNPDNIDPPEP
jgi:phage-related protein (TIGR01555 family)